MLIQAQGESFQAQRREFLPMLGAWLIGGMLALLLLFYLFRGRIRVEHGCLLR